MQNQLALKESTMTLLKNFDAAFVTEVMRKITFGVLAQPFDMARSLYAWNVRVGLIEHSLLGSARFGRDMNSLEKTAVGPWARHV